MFQMIGWHSLKRAVGVAGERPSLAVRAILLMAFTLVAGCQATGAHAPARFQSLTISETLGTAQTQTPAASLADSGDVPSNDGLLLRLGIGDTISLLVYGRPELSTTTYVTESGTIEVPLAGPVVVAGETPAAASARVGTALREGKFLVNPQVTITVDKFRSQQVSVLGEVRTPSRFPLESRTTIFDLLAQAGGVTENGASVIYLLRKGEHGPLTRYAIDVNAIIAGEKPLPATTLRPGDTVYVPKAKQFYIYGEVQAPNMYRLEADMTVVQAITRGGGLNARGSDSRIEIIRRDAAGMTQTIHPELNDLVQENDVIRVKERIF